MLGVVFFFLRINGRGVLGVGVSVGIGRTSFMFLISFKPKGGCHVSTKV